MSNKESSEPEQPEPEFRQPATDEPWVELREFVKAAVDAGITNTSEMAELLEATKNEVWRSEGLALINQVAEQMKNWREIIKRLDNLLGAREVIAENQYRAELAVLKRIQELSKDALAEDLNTLANAYDTLRSVSVAPGEYIPDERHSDR